VWASINAQRATRNAQRATRNAQRATRNAQRATRNAQRANAERGTRNAERAVKSGAVRRVVVSVRREDEARGRDLEIPAELPAVELTRLLGSALGWSLDESWPLHIRVDPPGRLLHDDESLAAAGVADGARLILTPALARVTPPVEPAQPDPVEDEPPATPPGRRYPRWLWPALAGVGVLAVIVGVGWWATRSAPVPSFILVRVAATPTVYVQTPTPLVVTLGPEPTSASKGDTIPP
jgi:uncharacterized ubiquitin-like protein YukD